MDCDSSSSNILTYTQALDKLLSLARPLNETESISIYDIDGQILAHDIMSSMNVPPFDNSSMDGYAINTSDNMPHSSFSVIGTSLAGHPSDKTLLPGQAIRIMTGAKTPEGTTSVVIQENVERIENTIRPTSIPNVNENIRFQGEDFIQGECILKKGKLLNSRDSALIAACGLSELTVFRKAKIALFSTGDELTNPGEPLKSGQIYDSNRPLLINRFKEMNVSVSNQGLLPDNPEKIRQALIQAAKENDIIITSGGVSVGDADYIKQILSEIGNVDFWKVNMKPGKPLAFGYINDCAFIGLPGNPVSAAITFDQLATPFIKATQHHSSPKPKHIKAIARDNFKRQSERMEFQRGIASYNEDGIWEVTSAGIQGSAILSALSRANCHVILAATESADVNKGDMVTICLY